MVKVDGHLLDDVLDLELFLALQLSKNVDALHYVHHDFSLAQVLLSHYTIERFPIKLEACCLGFDSDICRTLSIVQHRDFPKHFSLHDCLYVDLLAICPSVTVELSLVNDIDFIALVTLSDYDCVLFISFLSHGRD